MNLENGDADDARIHAVAPVEEALDVDLVANLEPPGRLVGFGVFVGEVEFYGEEISLTCLVSGSA